MRRYALIAALLVACSPPPWRAGFPVSLVIDSDVPVQDDARRAVTDRLAQFYIPVAASGKSVRVGLDPACKTTVPNAVVVAHTDTSIWVCPSIVSATAKTPNGAYLVVSHEVGHLLGLVGHLPVGGNLMAPILDNYKSLNGFSAADIKVICSAGAVDSPVCD